MSKVNIEYDTESKKLTASIDGAEIASLRDVIFYGYGMAEESKFDMSLVQRTKNSNGTWTTIQTIASELTAEDLARPDESATASATPASASELISQLFLKHREPRHETPDIV